MKIIHKAHYLNGKYGYSTTPYLKYTPSYKYYSVAIRGYLGLAVTYFAFPLLKALVLPQRGINGSQNLL